MFSETVQTALAKSGWAPARRVSTDQWVMPLVGEGFTILPNAEKILQSFGGLVIRPSWLPTDAYRPDVLHFDPVLAASGDFERVAYWQERLNMKLSPIGGIGGGAILLLTEDSRVFSCRDATLWLDGSSFEDALENTLLVGKRWPEKYDRMPE